MAERPDLSKEIDSTTFLSFYYLKKELIDFCRKNGIPTCGGKIEITQRIAHFLDTGEIVAKKTMQSRKSSIVTITKDTLIENDFVCSEKHRAFFKEQIGKGFSFNVAFQKWLKSNAGKTYDDAINAYYQILEDKKKIEQRLINNLNTILIYEISLKIIKENL